MELTKDDLTEEQSGAVEAVCDWMRSSGNRGHFKLGGLAGTGKTSILPFVRSALGLVEETVAFAAYTGKAARVMKKKGTMRVSTVHSLIYHPEEVTLPSGKKGVDFVRKMALELPTTLIVVDESSMIGEALHVDLMSFGIPVLYVGDYGQLPEIGGNFDLMKEEGLDHKLSKIHRQAEGNPIIRVALDVREGYRPDDRSDDGRYARMRMGDVGDSTLANADQIITGKNDSRRELNPRIRALKGMAGELPVRGDRLILLRNNRELGVTNGQQVYVTADAEPLDLLTLAVSCVDDWAWESYVDLERQLGAENVDIAGLLAVDVPEGIEVMHLPVSSRSFAVVEFEETQYELLDRVSADYAYAVTVHKSQGSEWDKVLLWDDGFGRWDDEMRRRWLYTAITRASERLIWAY